MPLLVSGVGRSVNGMANNNSRWTILLVLTILFGWLGVHRFYVGKVGTGLIWLFTSGVFLIGWFVDIVQVTTGRFTDKSGRAIVRAGSTLSAGEHTRQGSGVPGALEFIDKGSEPERDNGGRVIARLKSGSQIEIDLRGYENRDEIKTEEFLAPRKKGELDDEGQKTVRMRLNPEIADYWGGRCYRVETPSGTPVFEIRDHFADDFALTSKIINDLDGHLRTLHPSLASAKFVFDVAVQIDFVWGEEFDDEGEETGGVSFEWERPTMRLKDPLEVDIK